MENSNAIQINGFERINEHGRVIEKTMLLNVRAENVILATRLYNQLREQMQKDPEENKIIPNNGYKLLESINFRNDSNDDQNCPRCHSALIERRGKRGAFIGCTSYPSCSYTKQI